MIQRFNATSLFVPLLAIVLGVGCGDADPAGSGVQADAVLTEDALTDAEAEEGDVSAALNDSEAGPEEGDADEGDVEVEEASDLPIITEINEDVDLSEYFPDADVSEADDVDVTTADVDEGPDDTDASMEDTDTLDASDDAMDAEADTFLAGCDTLGVEPNWSGTFEGQIEYHIPEALEDLFYPLDGILIVGGILSYAIECVDSKLIVSGDMDGVANVSGEGDFPFSVTLSGYYNPETGLMNANLVDGLVVLFELAEIYFSGDFTGTLEDGAFTGNWTASYDGTNFDLPPGDEPEADGVGTWAAQPVEDD